MTGQGYFVGDCLCRMAFTVEENEKDTGVGQLLSTQQVNVLNAQVEGQLDNGCIFHVSSDVSHQGQVFHQPTGLDAEPTGQKLMSSFYCCEALTHVEQQRYGSL